VKHWRPLTADCDMLLLVSPHQGDSSGQLNLAFIGAKRSRADRGHVNFRGRLVSNLTGLLDQLYEKTRKMAEVTYVAIPP
jgi:hypothetical protein